MRIRNTGHRILACRRSVFFYLYVLPYILGRREHIMKQKPRQIVWFQMNQMSLSHELAVYLLLRRVRERGAASTQLPATSPPNIHQSSSLLLPSARYRYHLVPIVPYLLVKPSTGILCTFSYSVPDPDRHRSALILLCGFGFGARSMEMNEN
jgi:hypothetical protein